MCDPHRCTRAWRSLEVSPAALQQQKEALAANPAAALPPLEPAGGPIADLPSDQAALVWIQYMRFSRRSESVLASRKVCCCAAERCAAGGQCVGTVLFVVLVAVFMSEPLHHLLCSACSVLPACLEFLRHAVPSSPLLT